MANSQIWYCWVCGAKHEEADSPFNVGSECGDCGLTTRLPDKWWETTFSLQKIEDWKVWWARQERILKVLLRYLADKTKWDAEVFKREHPNYKENPLLKYLTTALYIKEQVITHCSVCGIEIEKRDKRLIRLAFCDEHYKVYRRAKVREAVEKYRKERTHGVILGERPTHREHLKAERTKAPRLKPEDLVLIDHLTKSKTKWWLGQSKEAREMFRRWVIRAMGTDLGKELISDTVYIIVEPTDEEKKRGKALLDAYVKGIHS